MGQKGLAKFRVWNSWENQSELANSEKIGVLGNSREPISLEKLE
jgi:hypothetical protein